MAYKNNIPYQYRKCKRFLPGSYGKFYSFFWEKNFKDQILFCGSNGTAYAVYIIINGIGGDAPGWDQSQGRATLQFVTQIQFQNCRDHGAAFAAGVLEDSQCGGSGQRCYLGGNGRTFLRQQGAAYGQQVSMMHGERDGAVENRKILRLADGGCGAVSVFIQVKYGGVLGKAFAEGSAERLHIFGC